jgi:hypothetical protein
VDGAAVTQDEFLDNVAALVAGLQVPVSLMPHSRLGAAYGPWQALLDEATGGFGWTDADTCRAALAKLLEPAPATLSLLHVRHHGSETFALYRSREMADRVREKAQDAKLAEVIGLEVLG